MPIITLKYTRQEQNIRNLAKWRQNGGMKRLTIDRINKGLNVRPETIQKYEIKKEEININKSHIKVKIYICNLIFFDNKMIK